MSWVNFVSNEKWTGSVGNLCFGLKAEIEKEELRCP
jgi:hypothetical protein